VTPDLIFAAIDLHERHKLAIWDCLIVEAAKAAACVELLTEDLQHGRTVDGLRIVDPFA
jgi:predicted nucleic acid-binding protein